MYERFTDRARKVMQLAQGEARRFNHEYIGTEHILLGLVKEGSGVAAHVLNNLDVDLRKIRLEVEKIVQAGPDMITLGKLPQTPRARAVIERAVQAAVDLQHSYVGTEHLLLGLIQDGESVAGAVLTMLGLDFSVIRDNILAILLHSGDPTETGVPVDIVVIEAERVRNIHVVVMANKDGICTGVSLPDMPGVTSMITWDQIDKARALLPKPAAAAPVDPPHFTG